MTLSAGPMGTGCGVRIESDAKDSNKSGIFNIFNVAIVVCLAILGPYLYYSVVTYNYIHLHK